jgi:hypothetical protein
MEERKRLSLGSVLVHTSQLQAISGTPCEVPVPRKVTLIGGLIISLVKFKGIKLLNHKFY